MDRMIEWTVEMLVRLLKKVVAMRGLRRPSQIISSRRLSMKLSPVGSTPLDEVKEVVLLPSRVTTYPVEPSKVELPPEAVIQLRDYVREIAAQYQTNSFHNFEHAAHVIQSVIKLMARVVVSPDTTESNGTCLHTYTYGITSDPLTQFAVAFSALIHDVDHPGALNTTLVNENTATARLYEQECGGTELGGRCVGYAIPELLYGSAQMYLFHGG
jgi:hypothetical protein